LTIGLACGLLITALLSCKQQSASPAKPPIRPLTLPASSQSTEPPEDVIHGAVQLIVAKPGQMTELRANEYGTKDVLQFRFLGLWQYDPKSGTN
jgi:hypothetical protein